MRVRAFCPRCWRSSGKMHACPGGCQSCGSLTFCPPSFPPSEIFCNRCQCSFASQACFDRHTRTLFSATTICARRKTCQTCGHTWFNVQNKEHVCHSLKCPSCHQIYSSASHYCFVQPLDKDKLIERDSKVKIFICFDIESALVRTSEAVLEHRPNLLISYTSCDNCFDGSLNQHKNCAICHTCFCIFERENCVSQFIDYILSFLNNKYKVQVCAHNFGRYDGRYIIREIWRRQIDASIILRQSTILKIEYKNIRFTDSLSLFPMALSNLPKASGFSDLAVKAFMPYFGKIRL